MLEPFLAKAKEAGLESIVIMDHLEEKGFEACKDWDDYVDRMASRLDVEAGPLQERTYLIVAHSHGCVPAWGLARRLSSQCLKLYPVGRRPPNGALLDDVWGINSGPQLEHLDDGSLLEGMLKAWPNPDLQRLQDAEPMSDPIKNILKLVRRQYSSPVYPCGSQDAQTICPGDPAAEAPILAIAASDEAPCGETAEKMQGWTGFTRTSCEVMTIQGATHMGIIKRRDLHDILTKDMLEVARKAGMLP